MRILIWLRFISPLSKTDQLPWLPHTCYVGDNCKPNMRSCMQYTEVRECCCDRIMAKQWRAIRSDATRSRSTTSAVAAAIGMIVGVLANVRWWWELVPMMDRSYAICLRCEVIYFELGGSVYNLQFDQPASWFFKIYDILKWSPASHMQFMNTFFNRKYVLFCFIFFLFSYIVAICSRCIFVIINRNYVTTHNIHPKPDTTNSFAKRL